jgi:hypothetical protein
VDKKITKGRKKRGRKNKLKKGKKSVDRGDIDWYY